MRHISVLPPHSHADNTAYASSVLENALQRLSYDSREAAFARCDDILAEFSTWPIGQGTAESSGPVAIGGGTRKREGQSGSRESVQELVREVRKEMLVGETGAGAGGGVEGQDELCFEVVATVLEIFSRMDSLVSHTLRSFASHNTHASCEPESDELRVSIATLDLDYPDRCIYYVYNQQRQRCDFRKKDYQKLNPKKTEQPKCMIRSGRGTR